MDTTVFVFLGQMGFGIALGLAAIGSALGIGAAGRAAAGAWAKEAKAGQPLRFTYILLVGLPLSQTIYAFILMIGPLKEKIITNPEQCAAIPGVLFATGLGVGLAELFSAMVQGRIGAAACRALSEGQGKGLGNMIIAMGIAETVGLFGFIFLLLMF